MAFDPFIGWVREDLESELRAAQEDYAAGKSTTRVGAGDAMTESKSDMSPLERIKLLYRKLSALDPDTYPAASISTIDRTRVSFYGQRCV